MDLFNLDKKVALITGGNGGIGYAMAKAMGDAGANIIIAGRNKDKNTLSVDKLKNINIEAMALEVEKAVIVHNQLFINSRFFYKIGALKLIN